MKKALPGIVGLLVANPRAAVLLNALAQGLLRTEEEDPTLSNGDRELAFATASFINNCVFCHHSHAAVARDLLDADTVAGMVNHGPDYFSEAGNFKRAALVRLAWRVAENTGDSLRDACADVIADAKTHGWSDQDVHDIVLIAASACMFNRYVDALSPISEMSKEEYAASAKVLIEVGYENAIAHMMANAPSQG